MGGGRKGVDTVTYLQILLSLGFLEHNPCKKQWMTVSVTCDFYQIINWTAGIHRAEFSGLTPHG